MVGMERLKTELLPYDVYAEELKEHEGEVMAVLRSPDGRRWTLRADYTVPQERRYQLCHAIPARYYSNIPDVLRAIGLITSIANRDADPTHPLDKLIANIEAAEAARDEYLEAYGYELMERAGDIFAIHPDYVEVYRESFYHPRLGWAGKAKSAPSWSAVRL